jgi:hypothetical protein
VKARMEAPAMWRGTTVQACGLWPFAAGSGSPMCGAPLGQHLLTGGTVCGDPVSWFSRAGLITNPSLWVMGRPGTGKSSLLERITNYLAATGVTPLVLGDLKPDYTATVEFLGGQVIPVGRGVGGINILDPGQMGAAAQRIGGRAGEQLRAEAHGRAWGRHRADALEESLLMRSATASRRSFPSGWFSNRVGREVHQHADDGDQRFAPCQ